MKKTWLFLVMLMTVCTLLAQESGLDLLKKYRIPDTRYGFGTLAFSSSANNNYTGLTTPGENTRSAVNSSSYNLTVEPTYLMVSESDLVQWKVDGTVGFHIEGTDYRSRNHNPSYTDGKTVFETYSWKKNPSLSVEASYRAYQNETDPWSVLGSLSISQSVEHGKDRRWYNPSNGPRYWYGTSYSRELLQSVYSGFMIGYGRIRTVTPVVNAIRFGERLRASGAVENPLSDETINQLADVFSRLGHYNTYNERPQKLIRQDVADVLAIVPGYEKATAFQTEYAFESLHEMRYARQEGWLVQGGLTHSYSKSDQYFSSKSPNGFSHSDFQSESSVLALTLNAKRYESLTLQTGYFVEVQISCGPQLSTFNALKQEYDSYSAFGLFYEAFDRWLVSGSYLINYFHRNYQDTKPLYGFRHLVGLNSNYFLEDQLALVISGSFWIDDYSIWERQLPANDFLTRQNRESYSISAGLTWYFGSTEAVGLRPWDATELNP